MQHRRRRPGSACAFGVALTALTTLLALVAAAIPAAAANETAKSTWRLPVDGRLVRPFADPSSA